MVNLVEGASSLEYVDVVENLPAVLFRIYIIKYVPKKVLFELSFCIIALLSYNSHTVKSLIKMYSSLVCSIFTELCNHPSNQF